MESTPLTPKSLSLPWKTRIFLWLFDSAINLITRKDGTVNRGLINLVDFHNIPPSPVPKNGVKTYDVVVDPVRKLWFRVFVPTQYTDEDLPVMVFFHGGAYVVLSPDAKIYDDVCRKLARALPAIVVSVNYRLAPENRHPAQHDDGVDVLKFLDVEENYRLKWLPENANISRCFVVGDSAGGHIAHHVTQRACELNFKQLKVSYVPTSTPHCLPNQLFF